MVFLNVASGSMSRLSGRKNAMVFSGTLYPAAQNSSEPTTSALVPSSGNRGESNLMKNLSPFESLIWNPGVTPGTVQHLVDRHRPVADAWLPPRARQAHLIVLVDVRRLAGRARQLAKAERG